MVEVQQTRKRPPFLAALADAAQRHGHVESAADEIADWTLRYILFHGKKHPQQLGRGEIARYLEHGPGKTRAGSRRCVHLLIFLVGFGCLPEGGPATREKLG